MQDEPYYVAEKPYRAGELRYLPMALGDKDRTRGDGGEDGEPRRLPPDVFLIRVVVLEEVYGGNGEQDVYGIVAHEIGGEDEVVRPLADSAYP